MEYRVFTEADIRRVIPLYISYYNSYEDGRWSEETVYKRIHQVLSREDSFGLILEEKDVPVGFAMGYFEQYDDGKAYDLVEIVISHEFQDKGLGTSFMRELERRVKEAGAFLVQLDAVNDEKHDRFYERLGYRNCSNLIIKSKML